MTDRVTDAIETFRLSVSTTGGGHWDADESMTDEYVRSLPIGRVTTALHAHAPDALRWLVYDVARATLVCWEHDAASRRPRRAVEKLRRFLVEGRAPRWRPIVRLSPFMLRTESIGAAHALWTIRRAAAYLRDGDERLAISCFSDASCAFEHSFNVDAFRAWFVRVAIPAALEQRELTDEEAVPLRG